MNETISNSSPLIGLSSINCLFLIRKIWNKIFIPPAVYDEVVTKGKGRSGSIQIKNAVDEWISISSVNNTQVIDALSATLDKGEAETIALAQERKANLIIIDNKEPRIIARRLGINVIGTIGVLITGWKKGYITNPIEKINELRSNGFWISDELYNKVMNDLKKQRF